MSDSARAPCGCGGTSGSSTTQTPSFGDGMSKVLKAQVPQDYEARFNLRIVPSRSLGNELVVNAGCKPRGHRKGWEAGTVVLNPALVASLVKADKTVMAWLTKDTANAQRFLANPAAALREAGVELERADEKALARASAAAEATRVVPPGVNLAAITVEAFPNGRVGNVGATRPAGKNESFGCAPKRKG